jgi:antitoxin component of MazEF toxin-antitoxin module
MAQVTIISHGDSAAVVVPLQLLESVGLRVGDTVEASIVSDELVLRASTSEARRQQVSQAIEEVLDARQDAYRRLA